MLSLSLSCHVIGKILYISGYSAYSRIDRLCLVCVSRGILRAHMYAFLTNGTLVDVLAFERGQPYSSSRVNDEADGLCRLG